MDQIFHISLFQIVPKIGIIIMAHELKYKLGYGITRPSPHEFFSSIEACEASARLFCTCPVAFVLEPGDAYPSGTDEGRAIQWEKLGHRHWGNHPHRVLEVFTLFLNSYI